MFRRYFIPVSTILFMMIGCQEQPQQDSHSQTKKDNTAVALNSATKTNNVTSAEQKLETPAEDKQPPTPPIMEDFQDAPKLSLFPRVGDFQPSPESERHPYWRTFIDHLAKVTGVAEDQSDGNRAWVFRSINSIDSLGYFSPISVEPNKIYQVSFKLFAELPKGATAGIGILEFDEFLWIGEQYTEETFKKHFRGAKEGRRLTGKPTGMQNFDFTTGPDTHMIHLVLFREGPHDRNSLMFDDISIKFR